ncbi:diguanylate cyclase [Kordiimonas sp.]|uniref:GGDEF domain-containing response regulator n=1 Tax=Kordiimonas sp. TaxID=1970157 RepID=UPI003A944BAE
MGFHEKILVIDDSAIVLEMIERSVGDMADVITAQTGKTGLLRLLEEKPTVILLDVKLPDIDGLKLCRAIKADSRTKHVPVLLITGEDTGADAEATAFGAGAADFIRKPMHPAVVRARVKLQLDLEMRTLALNAANVELQRLASLDTLTGCLNRPYFISAADAELSRMKRHRYPVSIAVLDLDHLEHIGEAYGRAVGEEVLRGGATCMKQSLRQEDSLARLGSGEFGVLLPVAGAEGAKRVLTRMCERLHSLQIKGMDPDVGLSVSIGLAEVHLDDMHVEDTIARASAALSLARKAGPGTLRVA